MKKILFLIGASCLVMNAFSQTAGDYRSKTTGNWNVNGTWERYNGTAWVAATATPTSADGVITIQSGHNVTNTTSVTVDQVVVNSGGTLTISGDMVVNNGAGTDLSVNGTLSLTYGVVSGAGIANIASTFNWTGGTLNIATTVTAAATANLNGGEVILGNTLTNNGTINWSSSYLSFNGGTLVNNNMFNNTGNGYLYKYSTGIINNNSGGTLKKLTSTGVCYSYVDINNTGIIDVQAGTFSVYTDTLTNSSVINIASGATFQNSHVCILNSGTSFTGAGTLQQSTSYSLTVNLALSISSAITMSFTAGNINGTGSLSVAGTINWSGGTLSIPALFTTTATANITGGEVIIANTLTNNGTINWGSTYLSFNGGSIINNKNLYNTSNGYFYKYTTGSITNNSGAVLRKLTGTGITYSYIDINNAGTIDVQSGTFSISSDTFTNSSVINIAAGATFQNAYVSFFNSGTSITGAGTLQQATGYVLTCNIALNIPSTIALSVSSGNINGTGSLNISGTLTWAGGTISIPTTLSGTATTNAISGEIIIANTFTNNGTFNWGSLYMSFNGGTLINNNLVNNTGNGNLYKYSTGVITNNTGATFRKSTGTGTTYSYIDVNNAGTIDVQSGTFQVYSDTLTNNGVINIAAGKAFQNNYVSIFNTGSSITGTGTFAQQTAYTLTVNNSLVIPASITFNIAGGTINGSGGLNVQSANVNWSSGSLSVPATFAASVVARLTGYEQILKNTLTNNGNIIWSSSYLSFDNGTLINNKNFIDSAASASTTFFYKYAGTGQFTNGTNGVFQKPTNSTFILGSVLFTNNGTIKGIGTCTFGSNLTNNARGIFAPGNSPGILVTGTGYLNRTLQIEMQNGGAAGNGYDQLQVNGIAQLRDTLKVVRTGVVPEGTYTILTVNGASDSITGNFAVVQTPPGYTVIKTKKTVRIAVPKPSVSIRDTAIVEGNAGSKFIRFILALDNPVAVTATVNFSTQDSTATVAGGDYQTTAGTATFNPGESFDTIQVRIYGDTTIESDEVFKVNLSSPVNILLADSVGVGTILNNDGPVPLYAGAGNADMLQTSGLIIPNIINRSQPWNIQGLFGTKNSVMLYDAAGRKIFEVKNTSGQINIAALNKGYYFYNIQLNNKIYKGQLLITD